MSALRRMPVACPSPLILWLAALLAASLGTSLALFGLYLPGDVAIAQMVQAVRLPFLEVASQGLYQVGLAPVFQIVALVIACSLFCRRHRLASAFVLLAVAARGMSFVLKDIVERPRPSPLLVDVSEQANGFSFPSGHVLGTVLLLGFTIYLAREVIPNRSLRLAVQAASAIVIALMGLQRVYAGAHWPTDVLAAYLWGGVFLFLLVQAYRFCVRCQWRPLAARMTGRV